ncbi:DUF1801 domain-containing protein [Paucibacter sp. KBW04]|uniref:DUF1801 domain-containing protein n=1 Tax=Paucibacter sp. KBW04 TaxID=2153361 RepID=UPI000F57EC13|nr:DUF1801 domain-containing protein [Paucibacter sp. KBW04]RQO53461.1 DUF1801 domain-containing protein [Paucibacter sp. KBW04]
MPNKSVDALLQDIRLLSEERYQIVQAVRELLLSHKDFKPCSEELKYGGILFSAGVQFCGVFAYKEHVSVEFGHGADIDDAWGLLEGAGKLRRHLKLRSLDDIQDKRLKGYLDLALAAAKQGMG